MTKKQLFVTKNKPLVMLFSVLLAFAISFYLYHSKLDIAIHGVAVHWAVAEGSQEVWGYLSRMGQEWFQILTCVFFGVYYYFKCNYRMSRLWYGSIVVYLSAGVLVQFIKAFVGRPRPKMLPQYEPEWFEMAARMHSWPSGHTITTFAWLACLLPFYPRKIQVVLALTACLVSFSRIGIGAHYMS
ncbi:MAG: membrane-associated phospholipid phosphatase, partial [Alphaproteobacteria bacterium]